MWLDELAGNQRATEVFSAGTEPAVVDWVVFDRGRIITPSVMGVVENFLTNSFLRLPLFCSRCQRLLDRHLPRI